VSPNSRAASIYTQNGVFPGGRSPAAKKFRPTETLIESAPPQLQLQEDKRDEKDEERPVSKKSEHEEISKKSEAS
jgi:hypothetical protein